MQHKCLLETGPIHEESCLVFAGVTCVSTLVRNDDGDEKKGKRNGFVKKAWPM